MRGPEEYSPSPERIGSPYSTDASSPSDTPNFDKLIRRANFIRKVDRLKFVMNFIHLIMTAVLVTKDAKYYAYYNVFMTWSLIMHRGYEFYMKGWHFYMVDFCYLVNFIVACHVVVFPKSEIMFFAGFALSLGPIFNSVSYYRNTLAFHSTEKTTSLFIHSSPPLTMFLIHWHDRSNHFASSNMGIQEYGPIFLAKWYGSVIALYGAWVVCYYIVLFKILRGHIVKNNYDTLYDHAMADSRTSRELRSRGEKWTKFMFIWVHFRYVLQFITMTQIFYYFYWVGLVWVIYNHALGIYFGATYYINYHSERYEKNLFSLGRMKEKAKEKTN